LTPPRLLFIAAFSYLAISSVTGCTPSIADGVTSPWPPLTVTEKTALRTVILSRFRSLPAADLEVAVEELSSDTGYREVLGRQRPVAAHTCSSGFGRCSIFEIGRYSTDGTTIAAHFDVGNIDSGPSSERFAYYYYLRPNAVGRALIRRGLLFTHAAAMKCPAIVDARTAMVGTVRMRSSESARRDFSLADVALSGPIETSKEAREPDELCGRDALR
jgi:hypothetical protein